MSENTTNFEDYTLSLVTIAMPADTNASGDIFGGWLLSQMDLAGANFCMNITRCRITTVGIDAMSFHKPVMVGDEVRCYCRVKRIGKTSITVDIDTWARNRVTNEDRKVTEGHFTYVAINEDRKPVAVRPEDRK